MRFQIEFEFKNGAIFRVPVEELDDEFCPEIGVDLDPNGENRLRIESNRALKWYLNSKQRYWPRRFEDFINVSPLVRVSVWRPFRTQNVGAEEDAGLSTGEQ